MATKVYLTEKKATLFITLYAKAQDSRSKRSILHDTTADELLKVVDYDFTKFKGKASDSLTVVRAKEYDDCITEFIKTNTNAVVLYLGCGLDTRVSRINPPPSITWFDVDYPEVIKLRKNFYSDRNGYQMIESSITDAAWLHTIPGDRPALIITEGVLEYLAAEEVKTLLNRLTDYFHHGEIMFDIISPFALELGKKELKETTGAVHKWAVDEMREIDELNSRLTRIGNLSVFRSKYVQKLPFAFRLLFRLASFVPRFRNMLRLVRYEF